MPVLKLRQAVSTMYSDGMSGSIFALGISAGDSGSILVHSPSIGYLPFHECCAPRNLIIIFVITSILIRRSLSILRLKLFVDSCSQ